MTSNTKAQHSNPLPRIIRQILLDRGLSDRNEQERFLFPSLADLPSPDEMLNLTAGAETVARAIIENREILIWGDYDVDGTTGTALLVIFFRLLGIEATWHIPNRLEEGYGLNIEWFDRNRSRIGKNFLVITVDCGTSDGAVIDSLRKMGGEVVVTDHHAIPAGLEPSSILINPSQKDCPCRTHTLAGVGVAFYLAAAVRRHLSTFEKFSHIYNTINLKELMPFVALGTVSDVVELSTVNRILVRAGMEAMKTCTIPGLRALFEVCDITDGSVSSEEIGFIIGPKINAAGRLGESRAVVTLLTETDLKRAKKLATTLARMNDERKRLTETSLETALTSFQPTTVSEKKCIIVCNSCHRGVAGIVASRLVDTFKVPAVVMTRPEKNSENLVVGSARSVEGVDILQIIDSCKQHLEKFGGHAMAAGISLKMENLAGFSEDFTKACAMAVPSVLIDPARRIFDIDCTLDEIIDEETLSYFKLLEPFGPGNKQPVFRAKKATIIDSRRVGGQAEHLNITVRSKYSKIKGIGFRLGHRLDEVQDKPCRDLILTPTQNRFRGTTSWQLRILDFQ